MNIKIEGNPGTGNTFQEINIGTVQNFNPNATTVINYNNSSTREKKVLQEDGGDITPVRSEILNYVSCIRPYLADEWKSRYMKLWEGILDLDIIASQVYKRGKQQGTNFNRNLVGNIIHYLDSKNFYKGAYNANEMTRAMEGDADHPVRGALLKEPDSEIRKALDKYIENFLLK